MEKLSFKNTKYVFLKDIFENQLETLNKINEIISEIEKIKLEFKKLEKKNNKLYQADEFVSKIKQQNKKLIEIAKRSIDRVLCNSVYECGECFMKEDCIIFKNVKELEQITGKKFDDLIKE